MQIKDDKRKNHFVLFEQNRINKLSPCFEDEPYKVIEKDGSQITIESSPGVWYKRNVAQVRRYVPSESKMIELDRDPPPTLEQNPKRSYVTVDQADISSKETNTRQRSSCAREYRNIKCPERLNDFVLWAQLTQDRERVSGGPIGGGDRPLRSPPYRLKKYFFSIFILFIIEKIVFSYNISCRWTWVGNRNERY